MNGKQLSILLVLVVVLGAAGLVIYKHQNEARRAGNTAMGQKLLAALPVNDVAQVQIKHGTNEVTLAKREDLWRVHERNDYPANYQEISDFLLKLRDLKVVQTEKVGASQLPRLALAPGEGTNAPITVDLKDGSGKSIRTLLLGKKHMRKSTRPSPMGDMGDEGWPDGRYVKVGASADTVALISDALANIEPKPEQWLNKDFIKIEKPRSLAVAFPNGTNSWKVTRDAESSEWKLVDAKPGEQLDVSKPTSASSSLSSPSFSDVAVSVKPEQLGLDKPSVVTVETFDNFTYTLKTGQKTNDSYPLVVAVDAKLATERTPGKDEKPAEKEKLDKEFKDKQQKLQEKLNTEKQYANWIYLVSSWTMDSVLKDRSQMLVEKKEEPKKDGSSTNAPSASLSGKPADEQKDADETADPAVTPPLAPPPAK